MHQYSLLILKSVFSINVILGRNNNSSDQLVAFFGCFPLKLILLGIKEHKHMASKVFIIID